MVLRSCKRSEFKCSANCPISLAWRLGGDSSLHWLRRLARSPGSRGKFKHVQIKIKRKTFPVSSRSRRRLRDVSISCGDVAETNFVRDWGDVSETCWRLPEMLPQLKGRLRDVAATARDVTATSPRLPGVTLNIVGTHACPKKTSKKCLFFWPKASTSEKKGCFSV